MTDYVRTHTPPAAPHSHAPAPDGRSDRVVPTLDGPERYGVCATCRTPVRSVYYHGSYRADAAQDEGSWSDWHEHTPHLTPTMARRPWRP
jgi:hypothetical protein